MSRIRVGDELAKLKDFQRRTVDSVFQRMYTDANPATRFLVADEVGLGKTLVARGLVARAIAHLKAENVERIDVIYVCSNAAIAQQNIQRLNVLGEQQVAFTTRLTLLPAKVHELAKNRVNFVSFTPNVALNVKSRSGTKEERVILYHLLSSRPGSKTALRNLLQATAGKDSWERSITDEASTLDSTLTNRFLTALANDAALCAQLDDGLARFARYREHPPWEDNDVRLAVIGNLRHALAKSCIDALEPDLVILDEFQRFSEILQGDDETSELARLLFEYPKVRVLLLSATPYKMLTLSGEDDEHDHFREFLGTARFLLRDESRVAELEAAMGEMRQGLRSIGNGGYERTREARDRAQAILRTVMSRMERVSGTAERDALVSEPQVDVSLRREDIAQSQLAQRLARTLGSPDIVEYWKSAPYLLSFMHDYDLNSRLKAATGRDAAAAAAVIDAHSDTLLRTETVEHYRSVPLANGRLRALASETLDRGLWKLLWMPPSLRYVAPEGAWADVGECTKSLIFSSWNMVPDAIAGLLSFEAERLMMGDVAGATYFEDRQRALLTFRLDERRPAGMTTLLLHYPSPLLADHFDPLRLALELGDGGPVPIAQLRAEVSRKLRPLLAVLKRRESATPDVRWYWAAPILLDARFHGVAGWVQKAFAAIYDRDEDDEDDGDGENASGFEAHVNELSAVLRGDIELGTFPEDLSEVLADVALGSPAVCAARALRRLSPNLGPDEPAILTGAAHVARGFRSLFNVPETMSLLRAQSADPTAYWRETLRYCAEGDLQAVLDEYAHYLRDDLGLFAGDSEKRAEDVGRAIARALTLRTAAIVAHDVHAKDARVKIDELRLRSRFAVRYGSTRGEEAKSVDRADDVRRAFNSPFRPFVLASTSVGQEGLDFHPYCHAVVHWNLPSNPVDLEQREGRVHRYKGHAIRKNIARAYGLDALSRLWDEGDPWQRMFELALKDRPAGKNDLWPYWLFEVKDGFKVERRVPMLPLSREHAQLTRLKKSLALYRLTFGQPRQEDLLTWLEGQHDAGALTHEQVSDLRIRLEATGEPIPPNEDPDPETDVDAVVTSLRGGASETLLRQWTRTSAALAATASLFSAALDAIPEAAASVHWTLNQRRHALRLNLGQAEVLTLYDGTLTLVADGLSTESTQRLRDLDAAPKAIPYDRLRRISPRAKWITVGVENVAPLLDLLVPAIQSFLRLDTRTSRAHSRDLLSVEAVQTIGRLAGSSWATWKPSA